MKFLHTGDWHVGKALRGRSRLEEHARVLNEIVTIARREAVDVVLVAGDVFETSAPAPDAQKVAWNALLALRSTGAEVLVIAGNHDSPQAFDAMRPLCAAAGIHLLGHPAPPERGGVVEITNPAGERARVACLPFVSQRHAVKAKDLFELSGDKTTSGYAADYRSLVEHLVGEPQPNTINILLAHATVVNATFGGGEREAHSIFEYAVPASVFPIAGHYVALGHLHRTQSVPAGCPAWYCGSPIQVDFGEGANIPQVLIIEATATTPAKIRGVELRTADRLQTIEGTLEQLSAVADQLQDVWLRVRVQEPLRAGLADDVRAMFARAVDVMIAAPPEESVQPRGAIARAGRTPSELFAEFLADRKIDDPRVLALFNELSSETVGSVV